MTYFLSELRKQIIKDLASFWTLVLRFLLAAKLIFSPVEKAVKFPMLTANEIRNPQLAVCGVLCFYTGLEETSYDQKKLSSLEIEFNRNCRKLCVGQGVSGECRDLQCVI